MSNSLLRLLVAGALLCAASPTFAAQKIGVLLKGRSPFWSSVEQGAQEAGRAAGVDVVVKAPLSESDISVQIQFLNALAAQGSDAIVLAPINKDALAGPVAAIAAKGVKIVCIDTPLPGTSAPVFVGTNHEAAGEAAGKLLASLVSDSDEVSILKHAQTSTATTDRENGALAAFRVSRPRNIVHADIYGGVEKDGERVKAELLLTRYPDTKAVLASSTLTTMAMLKTLQDKNRAGAVKLVGFGFNLNPEIATVLENGAMSGWIAQLPREVGAKGVSAAVSLLKGEQVPATVHTDFVVITKDNLKDPKVQALMMP